MATGKTAIAFQIAWKLFQSRWNLSVKSPNNYYISRRPRILFLADRNILADQAKLPIHLTNKYQSFEDAGAVLGDLSKVKDLFIEFQKYLYQEKVA